MYWNIYATKEIKAAEQLNSNIRCIEIALKIFLLQDSLSWIVTLDVLKCNSTDNKTIKETLNSNIRCIEIQCLQANYIAFQSWIVTLDVLKSYVVMPA